MNDIENILKVAIEQEPGCDQGFYQSLLYAIQLYEKLEKISPKSQWIFKSRLREKIRQDCFDIENDSHNIRAVFNDIPEVDPFKTLVEKI